MEITIGESQAMRRKMENLGDPKDHPRFKRFHKNVGGYVLSSMFVFLNFFQCVITFIDYFGSLKDSDNRRDGRKGR